MASQNLMDASLPHTVELSFFGEPVQPQRQRKQSSPRKPSSPLRQRVLAQNTADQSSQYGTIKLSDLPANDELLMNESAFLAAADTTSILSASLFEGKGRRVVSRQEPEEEMEVLNENTPPARARKVYERSTQPMKDPRSSAIRGSPARQASPRDPIKARVPSAESEDRKARLHDLFSAMRTHPQPARQTLAPRATAGPTPPRQPQTSISTQSRIRALLATKSPSQLPARAADRKIEVSRDADVFKAPQTSSRPKSMFAEAQPREVATRPRSTAARSYTSSSLAEMTAPPRIARSTTSATLATPSTRLPSSRSTTSVARMPTSRSMASLATPRAPQDVFSVPSIPARVRTTPIRSALPSSRSTTTLKEGSTRTPAARSAVLQDGQRNSPREYRMSRLSNEANVGRDEPVRRMR